MRKITKIAALAVLVFGVAAMLQPTGAVCSNPRIFNSGYSYIVTPGCEDSSCGIGSLTDNASGAFWAIGDGDPAPGLGIDNGSFELLGWLYTYPGYPVSLRSTWAAAGAIDGCIDAAADPLRCMAVLIMDTDANTGAGAFALLTDAPDNLSNYSFEQDGDITLATLNKLSISAAAAVPDSDDITVTVSGVSLTDIDAGLYLDAGCPQPSGGAIAQVLQGYQVFQREVASGAPAPDANSGDWTPVGPVTPLGSPSDATVSCTVGGDLYIAAGLVFDSNYKNVHVSGNSTKVNCNPNLVDPAELIERKPRGRTLRSRTSRGR